MLKRKCYWYLKCITVSIEILIHSDSDSCWFVVFYVGIHLLVQFSFTCFVWVSIWMWFHVVLCGSHLFNAQKMISWRSRMIFSSRSIVFFPVSNFLQVVSESSQSVAETVSQSVTVSLQFLHFLTTRVFLSQFLLFICSHRLRHFASGRWSWWSSWCCWRTWTSPRRWPDRDPLDRLDGPGPRKPQDIWDICVRHG